MATPLEAIANFRRVDDDLITAGQPTEDQLRAVAEAGFEVVINLAPHEDPRSLPGEAALVQSLGLVYINIPVPFRGSYRRAVPRFSATPWNSMIIAGFSCIAWPTSAFRCFWGSMLSCAGAKTRKPDSH